VSANAVGTFHADRAGTYDIAVNGAARAGRVVIGDSFSGTIVRVLGALGVVVGAVVVVGLGLAVFTAARRSRSSSGSQEPRTS
jgi:hypothetical protein